MKTGERMRSRKEDMIRGTVEQVFSGRTGEYFTFRAQDGRKIVLVQAGDGRAVMRGPDGVRHLTQTKLRTPRVNDEVVVFPRPGCEGRVKAWTLARLLDGAK